MRLFVNPLISTLAFEKTYSVVIIEREEWSINVHESLGIIDIITLTDGSVMEDGWDVFRENPIMKMVPRFSAELNAISLAAEKCLQKNYDVVPFESVPSVGY